MIGFNRQQFGRNTYTFLGVVEDRTDPMQIGRVRVRVHGVHTQDTTLIPTESLPWAIVSQDPTSASISGVGKSPTGILVGSSVWGIWLDGQDMQIPMVCGVYAPIEGSFSSSPNSNSGNGIINDQGIMDSLNGVPGNINPTGEGPQWLQIARGEIGTREGRGGANNPRVLEYLRGVGIHGNDTTPWCAAFARWCLDQAGINTQGITGRAKSFSEASSMERIDKPTHGCICVFHRPPRPTSGHVGFFDGMKGGSIRLLGGNQSDAVNIKGYSTNRLVGFYWPAGQPREEFETIKEQ